MGRPPCQFEGSEENDWPAQKVYFQPNHKTKVEKEVPVSGNTVKVDNVATPTPRVFPFRREDCDYLGRPPHDSLRLVCGPWGKEDGCCRTDYGLQNEYLTQSLATTGQTADISVCRKMGHKVIQVQAPLPFTLTQCPTGCAEGATAYWIARSVEEIHYGNDITGHDCISGTIEYQYRIGCPTEVIVDNTSTCEGEDVGAHSGGSYNACPTEAHADGEWQCTSLWASPYGTGLYQAMLDYYLLHGDFTGFPFDIPTTVVSFITPGTGTIRSVGFELLGSDSSYIKWNFEVEVYVIVNGGTNAEFYSALTAAKARLSEWNMDSDYIAEHGQTPQDDATYPWRTDALRTVGPLLYTMVACDGTVVKSVGAPATTLPLTTYSNAIGVLYSNNSLPTDGRTVTLGESVYTWKTAVASDGDVLIGSDADASLLNLSHAINNSGGTPGTDYMVTAANAIATATVTPANHTLTATSILSNVATDQLYTLTNDDSLGWDGGTMTGQVQTGGPLFDWDHRVYKWEPRTVCGSEQDVWVNFQYGRASDGTGEAAVVPKTAESFTDLLAACVLYHGSVAMYGPYAVQATSLVSGGVRGPTTITAAGGLLIQKAIELKVCVPSHNFFRPCGLDRLLMVESSTTVYDVSGSGETANVSYDADTEELTLTLVATLPVSFSPGDKVVVYGVPGHNGIWDVKGQDGGPVILTLENHLENSDAGIEEAGALRGPTTTRSYPDPDFGYGLVGRQRFPAAWPLNGRASVSGVKASATPGQIEVTLDDPGTLCPGDKVRFDGSSQDRLVIAVAGNTATLQAEAADATAYLLNAPIASVAPPHWTWFDTRPKGYWWLVGMTGKSNGSAPGDWWGPSCWLQPPGVDAGLGMSITESCTPASCCELPILDIPVPDLDPWTCGSVAANVAVQCVIDPLYQTPVQFDIFDGAVHWTPTFPTPPYVEPCASVAGLENPSAPTETVSLPAGCAFTVPTLPREQPDGAGGLTGAPIWLTPWLLFEGGKQIL